MLIYVVGYQPLSNGNTREQPTGFKWFPGSEKDKAIETLVEHINSGDTHSLSFVPMSITKNDPDDINEWLAKNTNRFEVGG